MTKQTERVLMVGFDGADPLYIKSLLSKGLLPNIRKVLENGATTDDYGMTGVVPTVTPPGWCSISTGSNPGTHGITCFWNHTLGKPLDQLDYGFLSVYNQSETIWEAYAKAGKKCLVVNYPTSYPPRNEDGLIMIDGSMLTPMFNAIAGEEMFFECRQGDFAISQNFKEKNTTGTNCVVEGEIETKKFGLEEKDEIRDSLHESQKEVADITKMARSRHGKVIRTKEDDGDNQIGGLNWNETKTPIKTANGWMFDTDGMFEVALPLNDNKKRHYALIRKDRTVAIYFSKKDTEPVAELTLNDWSEFLYDVFELNDKKVNVAYRLKLCALADDLSTMTLFVTCQMNLDENKYVFPHSMMKEIYEACGPVAKVYNYGGEDRIKQQVCLDTWRDCHYWQAKTIKYLLQKYPIDLVYTHFHIVDELDHLWIERSVPNCQDDWEHYSHLIDQAYNVIDEVVGIFLEILDDKTAMFITSDHALLPKSPECDYQPMGDTFGMTIDWMEANGYLKTKIENGRKAIDWPHTKATFQRSSYVYINLKGRDPEGCVEPEEYDALVDEIIDKLYSYRDPKTGKRVIDACLKRDGMEQIGLWGANCGDIFFVHSPEFARHHSNTWSATKHYGYSTKALFMACGAGIKKNYILDRKVHMIDVAPTIAALQGAPMPAQCEGGPVFQIFEK